MVHTKHEAILNSTFNEKSFYSTTCMWQIGSKSTISSIEDSFDPTGIKEIVEALVTSKFGSEYNKKLLKSSSRRSMRQKSSGSSSESTDDNCNKLSKKNSDYSIKASNLSELIPNVRPRSTAYGLESVEDVLHYLDTSKFGSEYNKKLLKSSSRRSMRQKSSGSSAESTDNNYNKFSKKNSDYSINTSDLSDLISNVRPRSTVYSLESVEDVLHYLDTCIDLSPTTAELSSSEESEDSTNSDSSSNLSLELLRKKKLILRQNREEILKAIHYHEHCRFSLYRERLEAEKILLITETRLELLFREIEELTCVENINSFCTGTIEISNMHIFPEEFKEQHFVCLITLGSKVFATEISKTKSNSVIYFDKKFEISSLQPNFELQLKIYSAASKVLKKSVASQVLCYQDYAHDDAVPYRKSIFSLWGEATIELRHLSRSLKVQMESGLFTACVSSDVDINMNLSGFVNVSRSSKRYPSWDRQFCILNEGVLNFYNYPPREPCVEIPTDVIILESCELKFPSREECCRKHTICLKMNLSDGILMSFDTQYEFECWSKYLNTILSQIRIWKC